MLSLGDRPSVGLELFVQRLCVPYAVSVVTAASGQPLSIGRKTDANMITLEFVGRRRRPARFRVHNHKAMLTKGSDGLPIGSQRKRATTSWCLEPPQSLLLVQVPDVYVLLVQS